MADFGVNVSVVIPFFSNIQWLGDAVESVLKQTYRDFEIIVVNDGSSEDDSLFIELYGPMIAYVKIDNGGAGRARNVGITKARGRYIAFLDSDDLWYPDKLKLQVEAMNNFDWDWSHTGYRLFSNETGSELLKVDVARFKNDVFFRTLISSPIATPCVMVNRRVFLDDPNLKFAENMKVGQDSFLWMALANKYKLGLVDGCLSSVRIRGNNTAKQVRYQIKAKGNLYVYLKKYRIIGLERYTSISTGILFVYSWCYYTAKMISWFEKKRVDVRIIEFVSKLLYVLPYLYTRLLKIKY